MKEPEIKIKLEGGHTLAYLIIDGERIGTIHLGEEFRDTTDIAHININPGFYQSKYKIVETKSSRDNYFYIRLQREKKVI